MRFKMRLAASGTRRFYAEASLEQSADSPRDSFAVFVMNYVAVHHRLHDASFSNLFWGHIKDVSVEHDQVRSSRELLPPCGSIWIP